MEEIVSSINNVPIRLPEERWIHIVENHDDLAGHMDDVLGAVESPDFIIKGYRCLDCFKANQGRINFWQWSIKKSGQWLVSL